MTLDEVFYQLALRDPQMRQLLMQHQMDQARGISDAVPRGTALPELPPDYQPAERWKHPTPVRMANVAGRYPTLASAMPMSDMTSAGAAPQEYIQLAMSEGKRPQAPMFEAGARGMGGYGGGGQKVTAPNYGARRLGKDDFKKIMTEQRRVEDEMAIPVGPETIKRAAVRGKRGEIFEGDIHTEAAKASGMHDTERGFITSKGRFVPADEASGIAERTGQVLRGEPIESGRLRKPPAPSKELEDLLKQIRDTIG